MSCPAGAPPSSGHQLLPTRYRRSHHQPPADLRRHIRRHHEQKAHVELLRHILTVPYFRAHYDETRREAEQDEDYFFVDEDDTMVQLTEVPDEHFEGGQAGPIEDEGDFTDTDSEISTDSEYDPTSESLSERLSALKDIVPPTTRGWISAKVSAVTGFGTSSFWFAGKALWFVSSTAIMLGVPFAICVTEEQQVSAMEQEYRMREMGSEALTEGGTADKVGAAIGEEKKEAL